MYDFLIGVASDFGDNIYVQVSTEDAPPVRWHVQREQDQNLTSIPLFFNGYDFPDRFLVISLTGSSSILYK